MIFGLVLGTPYVPFFPFYLGVSLSKLDSRKIGTLVINGLLGNLVMRGVFIDPVMDRLH